jgi:hypothetical protein
MSFDAACVHVARDIAEADIVVHWLEQQGIEAYVKNRHAIATVYVPILTAPRGVEVCVLDAAETERAKELLRQHQAEIAESQSATASLGPVYVVCEECGAALCFPSEARGRVENCPHCDKYVDVPE